MSRIEALGRTDDKFRTCKKSTSSVVTSVDLGANSITSACGQLYHSSGVMRRARADIPYVGAIRKTRMEATEGDFAKVTWI